MGLTRLRRWFGGDSSQERLVAQLIDTVTQLQTSQSKLMEKVLETNAQQSAASAAMLQSWFELWKPPVRPEGNRSTSMNERMMAKEAEASLDWEPLADDVFAQLQADGLTDETFV